MTSAATPMDNQPMRASFFNEGNWLTSFVTPDALEVQTVASNLGSGIENMKDRIRNYHVYVGQMKYIDFVDGTLVIEGKISRQHDLWMKPSLTSRVAIGNCANKAFLLTSLIRQELGPDDVYCILGNLHWNGQVEGHAWVMCQIDGIKYVVESTRADIETFIPEDQTTEVYEPVHYFNDQQLYAVEGRTVMEPFSACYSSWLHNYLDWAYIKSGGH